MNSIHRNARAIRLAGLVGLVALIPTVRVARASASSIESARSAADTSGVDGSGGASTALRDSLVGRSGKLLARLVARPRSTGVEILAKHFGDSAVRVPGVYAVTDSGLGRTFSFITLVSLKSKSGENKNEQKK